MPASRSARAMTLAPRSCPSSPGLAITTRSLRMAAWSDNGRFLVFAPDFAQGVAHLAYRRVSPDGVENRRHQIVGALRRTPQPVQRPLHLICAAGLPQLFKLCQLAIGGRLVNIENFDRRLILLNEVVDADDDFFFPLHGLLKAVGALRDFLLRKTAFNGLDHPAHPVDGIEVDAGAV